MIPAVTEACLYAAIAIALCLTSTEFGMFNLAAGMWLLLGGWWGGLLCAACGGPIVSVDARWALAITSVAACIQIGAPYLIREFILQDPLRYIFVALGTAMAMHGFVGTFMLHEYAATLSSDLDETTTLALVAGALIAVAAVVACVTSSKWRSRAVIRARVSAVDPEAHGFPSGRVSGLAALEIVLLSGLGAISSGIHKGLIEAHENYAIVPILAIVASRGRLFVAPLLAAVASGIETSLTYSGGAIASYAKPIKWAVIVLIAVFASIGRRPIIRSRHLRHPPARSGSWHLGFSAVVTVLAATVWFLLQQGQTPDVSHSASIVLTLSLSAWFSLRFLGVSTVAWPMIGITTVYAWMVCARAFDNGWVGVLACLGFLVGWTGYLLLLRVLSEERALAVDLALVLCLFEVARTATWISGVDHIADASATLLGVLSDTTLILTQGGVALGVVGFALLHYYHHRARAISLGLVNAGFGWKHGIRFGESFLLTALVMVASAQVSAFVFYSARAIAVTPEQGNIESGLVILLFGGMMRSLRVGVPMGAIAIVFLRTMVRSWLARKGLLLDAGIGLAAAVGILILPSTTKSTENVYG